MSEYACITKELLGRVLSLVSHFLPNGEFIVNGYDTSRDLHKPPDSVERNNLLHHPNAPSQDEVAGDLSREDRQIVELIAQVLHQPWPEEGVPYQLMSTTSSYSGTASATGSNLNTSNKTSTTTTTSPPSSCSGCSGCSGCGGCGSCLGCGSCFE